MTVAEAAEHFDVDKSTIRRWMVQGCPCMRRGRRGPGGGAELDLKAVQHWRGRTNAATGMTTDEVLPIVATVLWEVVVREHLDIRVGISKEDAAAACVAIFEACGKRFGKSYRFEEQPEPIRALMRLL
ncbi:MAG: hypothetical protein E8D47_13230 [Nitrospira sp.]|nr:MAG: hypothetical protein E8D47_13230 [Nitrospira sp.]